MNRDQLLDPEQQKKGIRGREDINSGNIKGKDGSVTTFDPIHPHEEEQRIKGSTVIGGDNIERETRDRDPIPTKMSTNRTPIYASSPTFPDQEQKPKAGALRREEDDHKIRNAHDHDVVPSKVFAKDSRDQQLAPNQLGEKSNMYMRTVNESPSRSKDQQPKSTKPNQAVDGVLHTGTYDLLPSSSKKIDGTALSVGDINRDVGVSSKGQPKGSDGFKEKPRIENIKLIKQQPPKDEADLSNSEIRPRKAIEHPVMHDKEDVASKESPKNINGRRAESSTTREQDDHPLKEQRQNYSFPGRENSTDKNDKYATSNSVGSSELTYIPEGVPIGEPPPVNVILNIQPQKSNENKNGKIEVDINVSICCRCSIL